MPEPPAASVAPVVVAGGGWAGLAAAVKLCAAGAPVTLVESARQLGGRARSIRFGERVVDNGQHLLTGACERTLGLLQQVGVNIEEALLRTPFRLRLQEPGGQTLFMQAPNLPAPLHMMAALLTAQGLGLADRIQALRFGRRLGRPAPGARDDISVQALLHSNRQTPASIRKLWEPLCISALNMPLADASARLFLRVLRDSFLYLNACSDLLVPRQCLTALFPQPALEYLERHGARVLLGHRVTALETRDHRVTGVRAAGHSIPASAVILATPHPITRRLMSAHPELLLTCNDLAALGHEPVATLYLQYPPEVRLEEPMTGLAGGPGQWIFDRRTCGEPGLMAVVVSARGEHTGWSREQMSARIVAQIAAAFPHWPAPAETLLVREKRATFSARVGIDLLRPANRTALQGLWLAGDYTATGLPATLESAVRSGSDCAQQLLDSRSESDSMV